MDSSHASSTIKRFLLFNIAHFSYIAKALVIGGVAVAFFLLRYRLSGFLLTFGIRDADNLQIQIVGIFIGYVIVQTIDLFSISSLQRWACQWLIKVNTNLNPEHRDEFKEYDNTISSRIRSLLPDELKGAWSSAPLRNKYLIPLRAEELISPGLKGTRPGHIKDLLSFLDLEYFADSAERLPPITIQGEPGSGKSTLIFELYRQHAARIKERGQGWIPIIIFAHELSWDLLHPQTSLQALLINYFKLSFSKYDQRSGYHSIIEFLQDNYDRYQFLIIIDGLDEITNRQLYEDMTRKLNELLEQEWQGKDSSNINRYIVTCRSDDNQRIIISRLITLLPIDYSEVLEYLQGLRKFYKQKKDPRNKNRVTNMIDGLETSRADRLLQNYISNPYLLSIIVKYYEEREPSAQSLRRVFENVLERELRKARQVDFESEQTQEQRTKLRPYLESLLAPYCYRVTLDSLQAGSFQSGDFGSYLEEDPRLSDALFGKTGYLRSVVNGRIQERENGILELANLWGDEKAYVFRDKLDQLHKRGLPYDEFNASAVRFLQKDVLKLLSDLRLAEIDETNGSIKRFRHRRMQDYFMAVFIERVGLIVDGRPRILLDNAWMKEPIRILAAISSHPEELLLLFGNEYEAANHVAESDLDSARKLELLLNASEAIAYLPRPTTPDRNSVLYNAVVSLGREGQKIYYQVAGKVKKNNVHTAQKCLTILRNVYASEFLRNDTHIFKQNNQGGVEPDSVGYWKKLHRDLQHSPGFYQLIAYLYLYPIRRAQNKFPISSGSLLSYIMDVAFCFPDEYHRLIRETHPRPLTRLPFKFVFILETPIALSLVIFFLSEPWWTDHMFPSWAFKVVATGILACCYAFLALAAHWFGLMEWNEFYHIVTWAPLRISKWLWPRVKYLFTDLAEALKALAKFVTRYLMVLYRWIRRNPATAAIVVGCVVLGVPVSRLVGTYIAPGLEYSFGRWQHASASETFVEKARRYTDAQPESLRQVNEFLQHPEDLLTDKRNQIVKLLDERKALGTDLINQGQYLIEAGKRYPEAESTDVKVWTGKLVDERTRVVNLETEIVTKEEDLRYAARILAFKNHIHDTSQKLNQLNSSPTENLSLTDMQRLLDETNGGIASAEALLKEGESLANEGMHKEEFDSELIKIEKLHESVKTRASLLSNEITRVSQAAPSVNKPLETENLKSILIARSQKALDRTDLNDLHDKLFSIEEYNKTASTLLPQIVSYLRSPRSGWAVQLPSEYWRLGDYLEYVNGLNELRSDVPVLQKQLDEYGNEVSSIISESQKVPTFDEWRSRLAERLSLIKAAQQQVSGFAVVHQKYVAQGIHEDLVEAHKEVSDQLYSRIYFLTLLAVLIALSLLVFAIYRRFISDGNGESEVESIRGNFDSLLQFIRNNGYSFRVNSRAIAYLKQVEPTDRDGLIDALAKISEVAWIRYNKPGDKNEKIGRSLHEVATGIDVRLNHQLPG